MNKLTIPSDELLESKVLGSALTSINAANHIFEELSEIDFFNPMNRIIFTECKQAYLQNNSLDFEWLLSSLARNQKLDVAGGLDYITKLCFYYGKNPDYEEICKKLIDLSQLRKLISLSEDIPRSCCDPKASAEEIIGSIQENIYKIQRVDTSSMKLYGEIIENVSERGGFEETLRWMVSQALKGEKPYTGIPSGYPILDDAFGYFRSGAIYYIGARTSMGKTTFLLNLMRNILLKGIPVGMFSLEMPSTQIVLKLTCLFGNMQYAQFEEGKMSDSQIANLLRAMEEIKKHQLIIDDQPALTISQIKARAKRMITNHGIRILMIDYLTLIKGNPKLATKHMQVDEVSKGLQSLAKELSIPILCLAQLNRQLTGRKDLTPTLSDFRESGSIEEDADGCILLHRPDYYDPLDRAGQIQIIVAKNRIRGHLRKIAFTKDQFSEIYNECEPINETIKRVSLEQYAKEEYETPF